MAASASGAPRLTALTDARSVRFEAALAIYESVIPKAEQKTRAQILAASRIRMSGSGPSSAAAR